MSFKATYRCDICDHEKLATNHWYAGEFSIPTLPGMYKAWIKITAWDEELALRVEAPRVHHLCGEECAAKFQSQFLGKLKGQPQ